MTIKRHESMAYRRRWRFNAKRYLSPTIFLIATWCRQMHICCATSIFSSQFAKVANGSANPARQMIVIYINSITVTAYVFALNVKTRHILALRETPSFVICVAIETGFLATQLTCECSRTVTICCSCCCCFCINKVSYVDLHMTNML